MASHHHHHHPAAAAAASSCYCHCYHPTYPPCNPYHPPPPPDPHICPVSIRPPPIYLNTPQHFQETYIQEPGPSISSLLRRIAALESALRRRSSPSQSLRDAAARSIQAHFRAFLVRRSITLRHLKELASIKSSLGFLKSRVSQKTQFDYDAVYHKAANLLLKLDAIQGGDPMIRNGKISLNREIYKFLDFIEGAYVQRRIVKHNVRSRVSNSEKKIGNVDSKRVNVEKLRGLVERIDRLAEELDEEEQSNEIENPKGELIMKKYGVSANQSGNGGGGLVKQRGGAGPKVKKNVSFVENGKVYQVLRRHSQPYLEECSNGSTDKDDLEDDDDDVDGEDDEEQELVDDLCREIVEIGVSSKEEVEDGSLSSDGEKDFRHSSTSRGKFGMRSDEDEAGDSVFCAPLPAKMERRSG